MKYTRHGIYVITQNATIEALAKGNIPNLTELTKDIPINLIIAAYLTMFDSYSMEQRAMDMLAREVLLASNETVHLVPQKQDNIGEPAQLFRLETLDYDKDILLVPRRDLIWT